MSNWQQGDGYGSGQGQQQYGGYPPHQYTGQQGYNQGYNQSQNQGYQQPPAYGNEGQGSAQSYYGANNEPYQQYPPSHQNYGGPPQYDQKYSEAANYPPQHQQYDQRQQYGQHQQYGPEYSNYDQREQSMGGPPQAHDYRTGPQGQYPPQPGQEGDRGVMGALAGGAAGAWGGHQVHHGVLGGIGGAVAGSMLEDAYKKHNKKEKHGDKHKRRSRRGSKSSSSSSSSSSSDDEKKRRHHVGAGNFRSSSRGVHLDGHSVLVAECADLDGHHHRAGIDLNDCLTNSDGRLQWARHGNFAASARSLHLSNDENVLVAELCDTNGHWRHDRIDLNEMISNDNGRLVML